MRNIKLWGGLHGNEPQSIRIAESLHHKPLPGVHSDIANPRACALEQRCIDLNMSKIFPGNPEAATYEERRAAEVLAQSRGYYGVVDLHDLTGSGENTGYISASGVSPIMLGFLANLGVARVIVNNNSIQRHVPNTVLIDLDPNPASASTDYFLHHLEDLTTSEHPRTAHANDFLWYEQIGGLHVDTIEPHELPPDTPPYELLDPAIARRLGMGTSELCIFNQLSEPNQLGYWAEVLIPVPVPDDSHWPADS
jgi:hypothetical protein